MTEMLEKLREAKALVDGEQDNLCKALMMLSAAGSITVVPRDDGLLQKPVIMVSKQMYNRMLKLSESPER